MGRVVLIDTGPIVAALLRRDQHHAWARAQFEALHEPCLTCEAVLSECFSLLARTSGGTERLRRLLERGVIVSAFSLHPHLAETLRLARRYADTPMSFADACLVRLAEMHDGAVVFTTDRDFETYRKNGRQVIPLLKSW